MATRPPGLDRPYLCSLSISPESSTARCESRQIVNLPQLRNVAINDKRFIEKVSKKMSPLKLRHRISEDFPNLKEFAGFYLTQRRMQAA
eukprot:766311-Hanusia_phi.AAC.4